jgi:hypothetical protein
MSANASRLGECREARRDRRNNSPLTPTRIPFATMAVRAKVAIPEPWPFKQQ